MTQQPYSFRAFIVTDSSQTDELEQNYLRFVRRILSDLGSWIAIEGLQRRESAELHFTEDGIGLETNEYSAYGPILMRHYGEQVWGTAEAEACAEVHLLRGVLDRPKLSDNEGRAIVDPSFDQLKPFLVIKLITPLVEAAERHDTLDLSESQILDSYRAARSLWTTAEFQHQVLVPLYQFESDIDRLRISDLVELSAFLPVEKTSTWMMGVIPSGGPNLWQYHESKYKLLATKILPRGQAMDRSLVNKDVYHFVSALRLLKPGHVATLGTFMGTANKRASGYSGPPPELSVSGSSTLYRLSKSESVTALALFRQLKKGFENGHLKALTVALRRFNLSYARSLPEDRLIDLTIALESSVLSDLDTELKYRLGLRCARLLSPVVSPKQTHLLLAAISDVRNQVVHGGKSIRECMKRGPVSKVTPRLTNATDLVVRGEQAVREVLNRYISELHSGKSLAKVNQEIDDGILGWPGNVT